MWNLIHQYGYFFSLLLFILPISLLFDAGTNFRALKALASLKGIIFIVVSVIFWFCFDIFWLHGLGSFPDNRVVLRIGGVPLEEIMLFIVGFYNIAAIFTWAKQRYP